MEDAQHFPAWTAWAGLTDEERRAAGRLAKQGHEHPDPRVAAAAYGWAEVLAADHQSWHEERWLRRALAVPGLVLAGDLGFVQWLTHRAEQRWAGQVLRTREGQS